VSNKLSKYRRGCGLSQVALAGRSKVSAAYLALLEQSGRTPGIAVAKALGKALGRPAEQVFPFLRLPHPGVDRFRQLALTHPGPAGELTAAQKAMVKDVLSTMPEYLFKGALHAKWTTAWATIEAFGLWVKKFPDQGGGFQRPLELLEEAYRKEPILPARGQAKTGQGLPRGTARSKAPAKKPAAKLRGRDEKISGLRRRKER